MGCTAPGISSIQGGHPVECSRQPGVFNKYTAREITKKEGREPISYKRDLRDIPIKCGVWTSFGS